MAIPDRTVLIFLISPNTNLSGFSEDLALAYHFVAICPSPILPPYRSTIGVGYASRKLSKMAENSACFSTNSRWIDKIINSYRIVANFM